MEEKTIINNLLKNLFPISRSITGDGVRQTFNILKPIIDFTTYEIPSGTEVFDWTIPKEWKVEEAYIKDSNGNYIIKLEDSNLHIMNYSVAVDKKLTFTELDKHLYTLEDLPDAIPYRTSYYNESWGFCLSHNQYLTLDRKGEYYVYIKSKHFNGSLTLGEKVLHGELKDEILISSYCCHPSMANDNLSGPITQAMIYHRLKNKKLKYTYRFLLLPETIGPIAYLSQFEKASSNIKFGFVLTTCGGPGKFGRKRSFLNNHLIDDAIELSFKERSIDFIDYPFIPDGSDERQYSSPGFRIPVTTITKDKYYEYIYYHTSKDDLNFVKPEAIKSSVDLYMSVLDKIENNKTYINLFPKGELQLGKRDLYPKVGGAQQQQATLKAKKDYQDEIEYQDEVDSICWFLFLSDGKRSLLDIAKESKVPFTQLYSISKKLLEKNIIKQV